MSVLSSLRPAAIGFALAFGGLSSAVAAPVALDVGQWGGTGDQSNRTAGYWFTAPTDFRITALYLPSQAGGDGSTLQLLRFSGAVPNSPATGNNFVSLGFWEDLTSVSTNILINAGDVIGVLGYGGARSSTPLRDDAGNYDTTLAGFDISLVRLGFNGVGPAANVWQENDEVTGVIGLNYERLSVPEPASLALALSTLGLMAFVRRRPTV